MLVIVLKFLGYLLPKILIAFVILVIIVFISNNPSITSTIMMNIQYAIHTLVYHIVHYVMHSFHPLWIYLIFSIHVRIPSYWHTDCIYTSLSNHFHQLRLGNRISPTSFPLFPSSKPPIFTISISIQRVPQVPTNLHFLNSLCCCFKLFGRSRGFPYCQRSFNEGNIFICYSTSFYRNGKTTHR